MPRVARKAGLDPALMSSSHQRAQDALGLPAGSPVPAVWTAAPRMAPSQASITGAVQRGAALLDSAGNVVHNGHTLSSLAAVSAELLPHSRRAGRSKTAAQQVAGSYYKCLKALAELENDLVLAGVPIGAHGPSQPVSARGGAPCPPPMLALQLVSSVPFGAAASPRAPRAPPKTSGLLGAFSARVLFPNARLRWLFLVYFPVVAVLAMLVVLLSMAVRITHVLSERGLPEVLVDGLFDLAAGIPSFFWHAGVRIGDAAWERLFSRRRPFVMQQPRVMLTQPEIAPFDLTTSHQAIVVLILVTLFGWVLSAPPPAQPAAKE